MYIGLFFCLCMQDNAEANQRLRRKVGVKRKPTTKTRISRYDEEKRIIKSTTQAEHLLSVVWRVVFVALHANLWIFVSINENAKVVKFLPNFSPAWPLQCGVFVEEIVSICYWSLHREQFDNELNSIWPRCIGNCHQLWTQWN